ncbi:MAG: hypothetical protein MHM6MM_004549 [Cercozoa sp. M6MM]
MEQDALSLASQIDAAQSKLSHSCDDCVITVSISATDADIQSPNRRLTLSVSPAETSLLQFAVQVGDACAQSVRQTPNTGATGPATHFAQQWAVARTVLLKANSKESSDVLVCSLHDAMSPNSRVCVPLLAMFKETTQETHPLKEEAQWRAFLASDKKDELRVRMFWIAKSEDGPQVHEATAVTTAIADAVTLNNVVQQPVSRTEGYAASGASSGISMPSIPSLRGTLPLPLSFPVLQLSPLALERAESPGSFGVIDFDANSVHSGGSSLSGRWKLGF